MICFIHMEVVFEYSKEKDIWCILNYGKSSLNSSQQTKIYQQVVDLYGKNPKTEMVATFIDDYLVNNHIDIQKSILQYQTDWNTVAQEYQRRAENIFGVALPSDVTAYLTINNRSPYSVEENWFFVGASGFFLRKTVMHELWHFYTWYKYGVVWEEKIGRQEYNEIKEALTVLLNEECKDLLPDGIIDTGYPQHQELRRKISDIWRKEKDMDKLWGFLVNREY